MPIDQLLQLIGLKEFQLANAQGENSQLREHIAQLEAELATQKPSRRKKAE